MMKKHLTILVALFLALILLICFLEIRSDQENTMDQFAMEYLETMKKGVEESVDYIYWDIMPQDRQSYLETKDRLLDYKIVDTEQINESLKAYTILYRTQVDVDAGVIDADEFVSAYNFVANIDGTLFFILNVNSVPENLRENLITEKYSYNDPNVMYFD